MTSVDGCNPLKEEPKQSTLDYREDDRWNTQRRPMLYLSRLCLQSGVVAHVSSRPQARQTYCTRTLNLLTRKISGVASPMLPPRPPPFFPPRAVERVFAQLLIHRGMRLAHPRAKLASARYSWRIPRHPGLKILGADPARVQLPKSREKGLGLGLELRSRLRRVRGGYGVQQRPRTTPEGFHIGRTVGWEGLWRGNGGGGGGFVGGLGGGLGFAASHGEPGSYVGTGTASYDMC
jgi:hypothetical protein